jgi:hypothetical protein
MLPTNVSKCEVSFPAMFDKEVVTFSQKELGMSVVDGTLNPGINGKSVL